MQYLNTKVLAETLLLIDFKKAFDTIEWGSIKSALKAYNFVNVCGT